MNEKGKEGRCSYGYRIVKKKTSENDDKNFYI